MASDRARISYDERRQWRSVVYQAGRVALESDNNEASDLAAEELRGELVEVVGVRGTPDDGYKVIEPAAATTPAFEVTVGKGTMYAGGLRVHSYDDVLYSQQMEWLDYSTSSEWWQDPATGLGTNEFIALLLREQEVGAVEDTALRDVALGGPDTCQRTRVVQHVVRIGTEADTCEDAITAAQQHWSQKGWHWDPASSRLLAVCGLKVSFVTVASTADPCEPQAVGGYLKPDNQLLRIKVLDYDAGTGTGHFVWGYDDASFLYRVQAMNSQTIKLASIPIDEFHQPRVGQAVEVLRTASRLATGWDLGADWNHGPSELSANDYVASADGVVQLLASDYSSSTQSVGLPQPLPQDFTDPAKTPALFLRVWESVVSFSAGTAAAVGDTGVNVTIGPLDPQGVIAVGASWSLAFRPNSPTTVYPERFLDQPQPPESPRLWLCPLAVVHWDAGLLKVLEDCRNQFDDLVDLSTRFPAAPTEWNKVKEINWRNDWPLTINIFNSGLKVVTKAPLDARTISENTFLVNLDVTTVAQFRAAFELRGTCQTAGNNFRFVPTPALSPTQLQSLLNTQEQFELKQQLPLTPGIRCRVVLKGNTILDDQGNPLDGNVFGIVKTLVGHDYTDLKLQSGDGIKGGDFESWFFLTLPPQVTSINPPPTPPLLSANMVQVTFSRDMDPSSINATSFTVTSSESGPVTGLVTNPSPNTAIFQPVDANNAPTPFAGPQAGPQVTYSIRLDGSVVKDTYDIHLDGTGSGAPGTDYTSTLKLVRATQVLSVDPSDGATVPFTPPLTKVVIKFTQPVDPATVNTNTFQVLDHANAAVTGTVTLDAAHTTATFARTVAFVPGAYKVVLGGVKDENGLPISAVCDGVAGNTFCSRFSRHTKPKEGKEKEGKEGDKDTKEHALEKTHKDTDVLRPGLFGAPGVAEPPGAEPPSAGEPGSGARLFITPEERPVVGRDLLADAGQ